MPPAKRRLILSLRNGKFFIFFFSVEAQILFSNCGDDYIDFAGKEENGWPEETECDFPKVQLK